MTERCVAFEFLSLSPASPCSSSAVPRRAPATLTREVPWSGKGVWLAADTHVHTKFSDGLGTPAETAVKARSFGCDVIGFADHGDNDRKGATSSTSMPSTRLGALSRRWS